MIDVLVSTANRAIGVVAVVLILRVDELVGIHNAVLVVFLAVVHGSLPEIDVCEQGVDGIAREVTLVAPVAATVSP